jgi:hypothetical protein
LTSDSDSVAYDDHLCKSGRRFGIRVWLTIITVITFRAAAGLTYFFKGGIQSDGSLPSVPVTESKSTVLPLVNLPGILHMPAISPDGSRVAFLWMAPDAKNSGIYMLVSGNRACCV